MRKGKRLWLIRKHRRERIERMGLRYIPDGCFDVRREKMVMGPSKFVGRIPERTDVLVVPSGIFIPMDEAMFTKSAMFTET